MPLFEYACEACGKTFEHLTRENEKPACEHCGEQVRVHKKMSTFASPAAVKSSNNAPGECGDQACANFGCQSGLCGLN